ncbi:MAG: TRAP transporter small permease [Rhodobacteraceae bacterium]|jgi:TRAP-type C4-dicarboxylate transport system permease small subunit|nr:TRAP transporter small permease [Paracoccaceae bacterium]
MATAPLRGPAAAVARAEAALGHVEEAVAVALLAGIAGVVNLQIGARYFFSSPFIWAEEIAKILMIWLAYVAAGAVTRRGAHIAVDSLQRALPGRASRLLGVAIGLAMVALFLFLGWVTLGLLAVVGSMTMIGTGLPMAVLIWPVIMGSGLIVLHSALRLFLPAAPPEAAP